MPVDVGLFVFFPSFSSLTCSQLSCWRPLLGSCTIAGMMVVAQWGLHSAWHLSTSACSSLRRRELEPCAHPLCPTRSGSRNQKAANREEWPLSLFKCQTTLTHFIFPKEVRGELWAWLQTNARPPCFSCHCHMPQPTVCLPPWLGITQIPDPGAGVSELHISSKTSCLLSFASVLRGAVLSEGIPRGGLSCLWMCPLGTVEDCNRPGATPYPRARTWSPLCNSG